MPSGDWMIRFVIITHEKFFYVSLKRYYIYFHLIACLISENHPVSLEKIFLSASIWKIKYVSIVRMYRVSLTRKTALGTKAELLRPFQLS